jgi:hypothetical protein
VIKRTLLALFVVGLLAFSSTASAEKIYRFTDHPTVGNVVIYIGLLPAEMIRGHPAEHPEATMHGGVPKGIGVYHVVIALFDVKTGERITNADLTARVSEIGLPGQEKKLEPMEIAGTVTYGNYFPMVGAGPFRISLAIHLPGIPKELKAVFEHRHG